jgi:hypothetical protein
MKRRHLALGTGAVAVTAGCLIWHGSKTPAPTPESPLAVVAKPAQPTPIASQGSPAPLTERRSAAEKPPEAQEGTPLPPHLADMEQEEGRALRSSEEEAAYRERLGHEESIAASVGILVHRQSAYSEEDEKVRMLALSHLGRALQVAEGDSLKAAISGLETLLLANNLGEASPSLKKSLAGDKVEAFALLWRHAPARAAKVRQQAKGTRLAPLIEFAVARESPSQNHAVARGSGAGGAGG